MKFEISRKKIAKPIGIFVAGCVRGWNEAAPTMLGALASVYFWKTGNRKTALVYGALTAGSVARMIHGAEADADADLAFADTIADKIRGKEEEPEEAK